MCCWYLLNVSAHISIHHDDSFASVGTGSRLRSSTRRMLIPSFSALHWIHPRGSQHQSLIHPRVSEEEYPTKVIMTNFHSLPALLGYNISFHPSLHPGPGHMGSNLSRETQSSLSPPTSSNLSRETPRRRIEALPGWPNRLIWLFSMFRTSGSTLGYIFKIHLYHWAN